MDHNEGVRDRVRYQISRLTWRMKELEVPARNLSPMPTKERCARCAGGCSWALAFPIAASGTSTECRVRDPSDTGACLVVTSPIGIPDVFRPGFADGAVRAARSNGGPPIGLACHLRRRRHLDVQFKPESLQFAEMVFMARASPAYSLVFQIHL